MEWIVLTGILVCVLLVIYGRLREELNNNKTKQIEALKEQVREQNAMAHKKDSEYLGSSDIDAVVGFLRKSDQDSD